MARESLFRFAPFAWLIRSLYAFPVRRGSADLRAMREAIRRLRAGQVVLVFPEATRTRDGTIGRLHPGPVALARRAGAAMLPMVIDGAFEAWPRWRRLPRPHPIRVMCGRPVPPEAAEGDPREVMAALRRRMLDLQRRLREGRVDRTESDRTPVAPARPVGKAPVPPKQETARKEAAPERGALAEPVEGTR